jgi:hypothetical protein
VVALDPPGVQALEVVGVQVGGGPPVAQDVAGDGPHAVGDGRQGLGLVAFGFVAQGGPTRPGGSGGEPRPGGWQMRGSYTAYSIGVAVVWGVLLILATVFDPAMRRHDVYLVGAGFALGWLSATIARSVYPPPKKAQQPQQTA